MKTKKEGGVVCRYWSMAFCLQKTQEQFRIVWRQRQRRRGRRGFAEQRRSVPAAGARIDGPHGGAVGRAPSAAATPAPAPGWRRAAHVARLLRAPAHCRHHRDAQHLRWWRGRPGRHHGLHLRVLQASAPRCRLCQRQALRHLAVSIHTNSCPRHQTH